MIDRWMEAGCTDERTHGKNNVVIAHVIFIMRGSNIASLVEFRPVV